MRSVDLITFCHDGDAQKLHEPGILESLVASHEYCFNRVLVIHQNTNWLDYPRFDRRLNTESFTIDRDEVVDRYVPQPDESAETWTGPENRPHYYKKHIANHIAGTELSTADYLVFADSDTLIIQGEGSWIDRGIQVLETNPDVLIVTCHWGGVDGVVQTCEWGWKVNTWSQQLFLVSRKSMLELDWNTPWNGQFDAPYGPMAEWYFMAEGRMGRYGLAYGQYRGVLKDWRYWHSASFRDPAPEGLVTRVFQPHYACPGYRYQWYVGEIPASD